MPLSVFFQMVKLAEANQVFRAAVHFVFRVAGTSIGLIDSDVMNGQDNPNDSRGSIVTVIGGGIPPVAGATIPNDTGVMFHAAHPAAPAVAVFNRLGNLIP